MKLKEGVIVHVGREKFVGEIPDEKAREVGLLKDKPEKKPAPKKDEAEK